MMKGNGSKRRTLLIVIVVAFLFGVVGYVVLNNIQSKTKTDASNQTSASREETAVTPETNTAPKPESTEPESTIDPATTSTVEIEPMDIVVSYVKGVGGFDYEVMRSPGGTKYVQFSASKLSGTKCTDDAGVFASIIEKPSPDEKATLVKTTTVNTVEYGLSLVDETCTIDVQLLKQYQASFNDAFSLLKNL